MAVNGESYGSGSLRVQATSGMVFTKPELRQPFQLPDCSHEHGLFLLDEHVEGLTPLPPYGMHGSEVL